MIWAIIALSLIAAGLIAYLINQAAKLKGLKKDLENEEAKTKAAVQKIDETVTVHNNQQAIQEEADEQKNDLEKTDNSDLVDRANNLFP